MPTDRRRFISQNDNYYSTDSFIGMPLSAGTYYVGVSSVGNSSYNPNISDSGFGGRTQGAYNLKLNFTPTPTSTLNDTNGVALDGDGDGQPGGTFNFWFQSNVASNTVYVDKSNSPVAGVDNGTGTLGNPFNTISDALTAAAALGTAEKIVRIVGNGGLDGNLNTPADNTPYLIGFDNNNNPLSDGASFSVPANVTVMIDAGTIIKLQHANLDAGTVVQGNNQSGGAIQVLGTPTNPVQLTSYRDNSVGGNSDSPTLPVQAGDWGDRVPSRRRPSNRWSFPR